MEETRDRQLALPDDPTGIAEAHDILAAEDFAMPAGPDRLVHKLRNSDKRGRLVFLAAAVVAAVAVAHRRR